MFSTIYHIQKITTNTLHLQKNDTLQLDQSHTHNTLLSIILAII